MPRLSFDLERIRTHYDVVVVGSGYGGAISASRLARAGKRVCVLERGRELVAGKMPRTGEEVSRESQIDAPLRGPEGERLGNPNGLYHFHVDERMNVLVGNGLGGTSLINANVVLRPDPRVFQDPRWPAPIRSDADGLLEKGFSLAARMLGARTYPDHLETPPKTKALIEAAKKIGEHVHLVPLAVTFEDGKNLVGVEQKKCAMCGDCLTGCNYEAKNTLVMNYLPDAKKHGAEIFTEVEVRSVERRGSKWVVHHRPAGSKIEAFGNAAEPFVTADLVVLAAGVLGTTEILLRSRAAGLSMSDEVGRHFSSNRNVLGFGYDATPEVRAIGLGPHEPGDKPDVGPLITAAIDMRDKPNVDDGLIIEEGVVPGAIAKGFLVGIMKSAALLGHPADRSLLEKAEALERTAESIVAGPYVGAIDHTMTLLVMGHDESPGQLVFQDDRLRVLWPEGREQALRAPNEAMERAVTALGATYVPNPLWKALPWHPTIAVQPLGGCILGEDAASGAVNHKGQLFSGSSGTAVHDGLYVLDGSIVPRSTGLNPLHTISALAERAIALLARDHGFSISYDFSPGEVAYEKPEQPGIRFTEAMRGHVALGKDIGFRDGERQGKEEGKALEVFLRITCHDLDAFAADTTTPLGIVGAARAGFLSADPLVVTNGSAVLFAPDEQNPEDKRLEYRFTMTTLEGRSYFLRGTKVLRDDPGPDLLGDVTTLFVTLHDGDTEASPVLGSGILHVGAEDFTMQLQTFQATGRDSEVARAAAIAKFGGLFGLRLLRPYLSFWERFAAS